MLAVMFSPCAHRQLWSSSKHFHLCMECRPIEACGAHTLLLRRGGQHRLWLSLGTGAHHCADPYTQEHATMSLRRRFCGHSSASSSICTTSLASWRCVPQLRAQSSHDTRGPGNHRLKNSVKPRKTEAFTSPWKPGASKSTTQEQCLLFQQASCFCFLDSQGLRATLSK